MAQHAAVAVQPVVLPDHFDLLEMHTGHPDRYPFLLESVATGRDSRGPAEAFDILFGFPGDTLVLDAQFRLHGAEIKEGRGFLPALDQSWRASRAAANPDMALPFHGGWFLYLGYELVGQIEPTIRTPAPPSGPVAFATRIPVALVRNRRTGHAWIVAEHAHDGAMDQLREDLIN
jgi:anthranilate synthase component 1